MRVVTSCSVKGSKALIVFIPFPFTGICDDEGCALRDSLGALDGLDAKVVVITVHSTHVIKKWVEEYGFTFPVLSDYWPHGETTKAYGAFNDANGAALRYSFVLDADGIVHDTKIAADAFWQGIYNHLELEESAYTVTSYADGIELRPYFNSHCFAWNPSTGLAAAWWREFKALVADKAFQASRARAAARQARDLTRRKSLLDRMKRYKNSAAFS